MVDASIEVPKKIDAKVTNRSEANALQELKLENAVHSEHCDERRGKFLHSAMVAIMIFVVWGLIIVSAASPFIPRYYREVYQNAACTLNLYL